MSLCMFIAVTILSIGLTSGATTHADNSHGSQSSTFKIFDKHTIQDLQLIPNNNADGKEEDEISDFDFDDNALVRKLPTKPNIGHNSIKRPTKTKSVTSTAPFQARGYVFENGWVQFKFEKSFILLNRTATKGEADTICAAYNMAEDVGAQLAVPQSAEEQQFINEYVFRLSHSTRNVWIGQRTDNYRNESVRHPLYANWAKGMPTMTQQCVQIRSPLSIYGDVNDSVGGKWEDVSCERHNLVLCQKPQHWSQQQFIRVVTDLKKEVDKLKKRSETDQIPLGFIYSQLPDQPTPSKLWPMYKWEDVSAKYAGLFFRVVGHGAGVFGRVQESSCPRLTGVKTYNLHAVQTQELKQMDLLADNRWTDVENGFPVSLRVSGDEIRPKNTAIKIWKRT